MPGKYHLVWIVFLVSIITSYGQELLYGKFEKDTIKIGEPVAYYLVYMHDPAVEVLFPDTLHNYYPFQFVKKEFFPTSTENKISKDSAIYILQTFEIDSIQKLSLPVFCFADGDSIKKYSLPDSIIVSSFVKNLSKATIQGNKDFLEIKPLFNFQYFTLISSIILVISFFFYRFAGKTIVKRYRLYTIRKSHQNFLKSFEKLQKEYKKQKELDSIEKALSLWKSYLTKLENKPINTFTSTEIINLYQHDKLQRGLQDIDKAIYGGVIETELEKTMTVLKKFTNKRFIVIKSEINNAT